MANARGFVAVNEEECKGCDLCVTACPVDVLHLAQHFNTHGYNPSEYDGDGCTGCGVCFYACPEPGALTVFKNWEESRHKYLNPNGAGVTSLTLKDPIKGLAVIEATGEIIALSNFLNLKFAE